MAGPNLATYLQIRERELESQISNVRGELTPLEAELAQIRKIRSLIADARAAGLTDLASDAALPEPIPGTFTKVDMTVQSALRALQSINSPQSQLEAVAEQLTIKQMALRALRDHFGDTGATPTELRDYMLTVFHKEVDRNSISPQLARLREEGLVEQPPGLNEGKWKLTPLRGISAEELIAIGHWPAGAAHLTADGEATRLAQKEAKRARKRGDDDFLE